MLANHFFRQVPVITSMLRLATSTRGDGAPEAPGPELTETLPPRPRELVADYVRFVGGDAKAWRGQLPPHLFPQWGFPLITRALQGVPYDLKKAVNAGFHWKLNHPVPDTEDLLLSARLESIDDDGRRALLRVGLTTSTASTPGALESSITVFVPSGGGEKKEGGPRRPKPAVPVDARPIRDFKLGPRAGLDFGLLTGDFNPLHWLGPYAKAAGFRGVFIQGFCTGALAAEALVSGLYAGDIRRLTALEGRFTRPQYVPGTVRLFIDGEGGIFAGSDPGGPATLTGSFNHG
jgi:hypothetical protein